MPTTENSFDASRRKFLAHCGKLALVTPPSITLMLATAQQNFAVAASGGTVGGVSGSGAPAGAFAGAGGGSGTGGGGSADFASLSGGGGGGGGGSSGSLGTPIPPECADISDPAEQAVCIEEYAKGTPSRDSGPSVESAGTAVF